MCSRSSLARRPAGLALALALALEVAGAALEVAAGPPEAAPPAPEPAPSEPVETLAAAEPPGFWLSVELIGPRGAQIDAAESLRVAPVVDALPRGGAPPPGELVGRVATREQALAWLDAHAFEGGAVGFDEPQPEGPAPLPGGAVQRGYGVHLTAWVVTAASPSGGTQAAPWPSATELQTPATWRAATLAVARAPVFAAPSPTLPPASERYQTVAREHAVWQLGALDRCTAGGECLRWAQILVRDGDRWYGGWIPAAQVVVDQAWQRVGEDRRFAVIASHRDRVRVGVVLVEQHGQRWAPPRGLEVAHASRGWPVTSLEQAGGQLQVSVAGQVLLSVPLAASKPAPIPSAPPTP